MSIEFNLHDNQERVSNLIKKFIEENKTVVYETSLQSCQAFYPLNDMITDYLRNNGLKDYSVYGVYNERTHRFSTTKMEIVDQDNNFTGVYLKYSKKILEDLSTYREDDYLGKVKVVKYKLQFKIKIKEAKEELERVKNINKDSKVFEIWHS